MTQNKEWWPQKWALLVEEIALTILTNNKLLQWNVYFECFLWNSFDQWEKRNQDQLPFLLVTQQLLITPGLLVREVVDTRWTSWYLLSQGTRKCSEIQDQVKGHGRWLEKLPLIIFGIIWATQQIMKVMVFNILTF